ncbi:hypothetical protein P280DRAFT_534293 [Massarina eburnea CBS 473.64]|uniref:Uncharacterized protein n=1 Tax=Massarina eburnea CBS 473.64 TaxID=1395130 RepID=A0A6A6RLK7_9PLEO|nr:hypothetical protein P280DRAFT_534293 [Massarina eburnea CBS 473.64]
MGTNMDSLFGKEAVQIMNSARLILLNTAASTVDSNFLDNAATSVGTSQRSGTTVSTLVSRIKSQYPRPPHINRGAINFKCPCCWSPLRRKDLISNRWRMEKMDQANTFWDPPKVLVDLDHY